MPRFDEGARSYASVNAVEESLRKDDDGPCSGPPRRRRKILDWVRFSCRIPKRYYVAQLLLLTTIMEGYILGNMSVVLVDINSNKTVMLENGTEIIKEAEFNWTAMQRSVILGINFVGHILACLISGWAVHRIGGATYLGIGKLGEAIITLTSPLAMNTHVYLFAVLRMVLGLFEGLTFVGMQDVLARWIPPQERVRVTTFVSLGYGVGVAINFPLSAFIIKNFGWEQLFYILGGMILTWSLVWMTFVSNDPCSDRFITERERVYLVQQISCGARTQIAIPYKEIFTSVPVYALANEFFISGFTTSFVVLMPLYIKDTQNVDIQTIGFLSCIPEVTNLTTRVLSSYFIDVVRSKPNGCGIGKTHKFLLFWGQFFVLVFFLITALCDGLIASVVCLTLARVSYGISANSYNVITIDVGGPYAGFLQSIIQSVQSFSYFINPLIVGLVIPNHSHAQWNIYFLLVSALTMYGVTMFVSFGSGDLQPWAKNTVGDTENEPNNEVFTAIETNENLEAPLKIHKSTKNET